MTDRGDSFDERFAHRLTLPLIAAPLFRISGPELVKAACKAGVVGAFPTANCRSPQELDQWLQEFDRDLTDQNAPYCPNLIMKRSDVRRHLDSLQNSSVEIVITSVGSPAPAVGPLHEVGCFVFADVASVHHAHRAVQAGVDGLVLLTAGAGGQTGWANGLAFARAVRSFFDGPIVMAGGIADGWALLAAQAVGCSLAFMGTKFIATHESRASGAYRDMLTASELDDVLLTRAFTGLETNMLRPSILAAGLDPLCLPEELTQQGAATVFGAGAAGPQRWKDIWSAGHSVSGIRSILSVAELVKQTRDEYAIAAAHLKRAIGKQQSSNRKTEATSP